MLPEFIYGFWSELISPAPCGSFDEWQDPIHCIRGFLHPWISVFIDYRIYSKNLLPLTGLASHSASYTQTGQDDLYLFLLDGLILGQAYPLIDDQDRIRNYPEGQECGFIGIPSTSFIDKHLTVRDGDHSATDRHPIPLYESGRKICSPMPR
jgi:hypothetical protein